MKPDIERLKLVKRRLWRAFYETKPGFEGCGIGEGGLRVYVFDEESIKNFPQTFAGIPLRFVVTGKSEAL